MDVAQMSAMTKGSLNTPTLPKLPNVGREFPAIITQDAGLYTEHSKQTAHLPHSGVVET